MFYDVLFKLCFQSMALYYEKQDVKKMQRQIKMLKSMGKKAMTKESIDLVHRQNVKRRRFERDFSALLVKMEDPNPNADLMVVLKGANKRMQRQYNHMVDTNIKMDKG